MTINRFGTAARSLYFMGVCALVAALGACAAPQEERALDTYTAEEIYTRGEMILEGAGKPKDSLLYFQAISINVEGIVVFYVLNLGLIYVI
jgi:hypothetical protein